MKKIVTVLGTRPEIIRLCRVIPLLDKFCNHHLVHTGQNYDENLNDIFFAQLGVRKPDTCLGIRGQSAADQIGQILSKVDEVLEKERPDGLLVLGDTNSGLSAFVAKRRGIPVYHMEAGNRCFDDRVPEEVNRRVIDHSSDILMPYTERSRDNLLAEGIPSRRIYVTGNPIKEVLDHFKYEIEESKVLESLGLKEGGRIPIRVPYMLMTLHRAENVDHPSRLKYLLEASSVAAQKRGVRLLCSLHPRTKDKMSKFGIDSARLGISFCEPFGFFDFVHLEKNAECVLTDSGTVQEECCIFNVPNVTLRPVTERPETIEVGSNILAEVHQMIDTGINLATQERACAVPPEYGRKNVAPTVAKIVLGHYEGSAIGL